MVPSRNHANKQAPDQALLSQLTSGQSQVTAKSHGHPIEETHQKEGAFAGAEQLGVSYTTSNQKTLPGAKISKIGSGLSSQGTKFAGHEVKANPGRSTSRGWCDSRRNGRPPRAVGMK